MLLSHVTNIKELQEYITQLDDTHTVAKGSFLYDTKNKEAMSAAYGSVIDYVLTETGRFCLRNLSDILIEYDAFKNIINNIHDVEKHFMALGIRELGVDNAERLLQNLIEDKNRVSDYYRKILYIEFICDGVTVNPDIEHWTIKLKDLKSYHAN